MNLVMLRPYLIDGLVRPGISQLGRSIRCQQQKGHAILVRFDDLTGERHRELSA